MSVEFRALCRHFDAVGGELLGLACSERTPDSRPRILGAAAPFEAISLVG